jgi:translation initiation factor 3 subunit I
MRLWNVATGACLYIWEFPTAVKRVAFSEDDDMIVCITEQRMGYQGAVRVFNINRADGTKRESIHIFRYRK